MKESPPPRSARRTQLSLKESVTGVDRIHLQSVGDIEDRVHVQVADHSRLGLELDRLIGEPDMLAMLVDGV